MSSFKPLAKTAIMQNVKGRPKGLNYRTDVKVGDIWELYANSGFYSLDTRQFDEVLFGLVNQEENETEPTLCIVVETTDHYTNPFGHRVSLSNGEKGYRLIKILIGDRLTLVIEGNLKKLWHRNPCPAPQEKENTQGLSNDDENS